MAIVLNSTTITGANNTIFAWVNYYTTGIRGSYNVNSVTRNAQGLYTIVYSNAAAPGSGHEIATGSARASTGEVGPNWAQYWSPYDFNQNYINVQILDNGDQGTGYNEDTAQASLIIHSM